MSTFQRVWSSVFEAAAVLALTVTGFVLWSVFPSIRDFGSTVVGQIIVSLVVGAVAYGINYFTTAVRRRQADTIVKGTVTPPNKPPAVPLTDHEKIDALYKLSRTQSRDQFISNAIWAVVGIIGGYLAGQYLPHLHL